ncbi:MBL fold metallo-hydrolase [Kitasatospora sp. KL5]|uniref:MBL fold metallo-hydrolase n=1 Tax=Kitasatospora sp. KL5 TaxID=3425125 RepID=UPI003D6FFC85
MDRNKNLHAQAEPFEPAVLIRGETSLEDSGLAARVMPTPGHTAGSVSVLTDDGHLVAGDLIANSFMGLIPGKPANPPFHDNPRQNLVSLRRMLALNPATLHVGHGTLLDPDRVRQCADREHGSLARLEAAGRLATRSE